MSSTIEKWREMGGEYRDKYESPTTIFEHEKWRRLQAALELAAVPDDGTVVDIGVGAGNLLEHIHAQSEAWTLGVDASRSMLDTANDTVSAAFSQGSVDRLPLQDDMADVVFCLGVLGHIPDERVPAAIRECARITRPGGQVILSHANARSPFRKIRGVYTAARGSSSEYSTYRSNYIKGLTADVGLSIRQRRYLTYSTALLDTGPSIKLYQLLDRIGHESAVLGPLAMTHVIACQKG